MKTFLKTFITTFAIMLGGILTILTLMTPIILIALSSGISTELGCLICILWVITWVSAVSVIFSDKKLR